MNREALYEIAGFKVRVRWSGSIDIDSLLPSFRPFKCALGEGNLLIDCEIVTEALAEKKVLKIIEDDSENLGHLKLALVEDGFAARMKYYSTSPEHRMWCSRDFDRVKICLDCADPQAGEILSNMLRLAFAQAIVYRGGLCIHASVVALSEKGYLFMGKSGTGKSTHARLWLRAFPQARLLNDDFPALRLRGGEPRVYGTPWSGKTPCYKKESYPVGGLVRLSQAGENRFVPLGDVEAFSAILPGCSSLRQGESYERLCDTLSEIVDRVKVGRLDCRIDAQAARLCYENIKS